MKFILRPNTKLGLFLFLIFQSSILCALPIREGLEYQRQNTSNAQVVHILSFDPEKFTITAQHAKGKALGLDTLPDLAKEHNAIAGINGGFFHMGEKKEGLPAGILKIQGQWYGIAYTNRAAVGWSLKHKPLMLIDRLQTKTTLKIKNQRFPMHSLNQPGSAKRAVVYTQAFGKVADASTGGTDFIVKNNRIVDIVPSEATPIPEDGFVYSLGKDVQRPTYTPTIGDKVNFNIEVIPDKGRKQNAKIWQTMENIVGGTPLLVDNAKVAINNAHTYMQSPFASQRRARTALGRLSNGYWVWVVVENNRREKNVGMSLLELAEFMKSLGCTQALNLDGGSSSALYLEDKIVTAPEDEHEETLPVPMLRRIADAILLLEK